MSSWSSDMWCPDECPVAKRRVGCGYLIAGTPCAHPRYRLLADGHHEHEIVHPGKTRRVQPGREDVRPRRPEVTIPGQEKDGVRVAALPSGE